MSIILRPRRFHRLASYMLAIPLLAGGYDAYEVATHQLEQQRAINWLSIVVPRIGPQPTWQFITAKPGAAQ